MSGWANHIEPTRGTRQPQFMRLGVANLGYFPYPLAGMVICQPEVSTISKIIQLAAGA